jgi:hypothetical protein
MAAPSSTEIAAWQREALAFLRRQSVLDEEEVVEGKSLPKQQRLKTLQWIRCVEKQLTAVGLDLKHFMPSFQPNGELQLPAPPNLLDAEPINILSVALDQGSTGYAGTWFLLNELRLNLVAMPDPSHRLSNDALMAVRQSGLWAHFLLMVPIYNFAFGPFQGCAWHEQGVAAMRELRHLMRPDDTLFLSLASHIAADLGVLDEQDSDGFHSMLLQQFFDAGVWHKKGPKANSSRWFSWFRAAEYHDRFWHCRLLAFVYWGLNAGWAKKAAAMPSAPPIPVPAADATSDLDKQPVPLGEHFLPALRSSCKNTMELCSIVLGDVACQTRSRLMFSFVGPMQLEHGLSNQRNRSPEASLQLWADYACGGAWLAALNQTASLLSDLETLDRIRVLPVPGTLHKDTADPFVVESNSLATTAFTFCSSLLRSRCMGTMHHWAWYPGFFCWLEEQQAE